MAAAAANAPPAPQKTSFVPGRQVGVVLAIFLAGSAASAFQHGLEHVNVPGLSVRLSSYLTVIVEEWIAVLFVWITLKRRGISMGVLISGRWESVEAFLIDLGLAMGLIVAIVSLSV